MIITLIAGCNNSTNDIDGGVDSSALVDLASGADLTANGPVCGQSVTTRPGIGSSSRGGSVIFLLTELGNTNGFISFENVQTDGGANMEHCTVSGTGPCRLSLCTNANLISPSVAESVGPIEITGGAFLVTLAPQPDKTYPMYDDPRALWNGGETIRMKATGADEPGFDLMLLAPSTITVTQPAASPSPLPVNRAQDLTVAWTPSATAGVVYVSIAVNNTTTNVLDLVECEFSSAAGTGTVPSALLEGMPTGAADLQVNTTCGEWLNEPTTPQLLELMMPAQTSGIGMQPGNVTLQ